MKKKITRAILLLSLFAVFAPPASCLYESEYLTEIFSGWVPEGGNATAGNAVFSVSAAGSSLMKIAFKYDEGYVLVYNGTCEESGIYVFCYENAEFLEYNQVKDSPVYQYFTRIKRKIPSPEYTRREVSNPEPYLWEEIKIITAFRNSGIMDIDKANYTEVIPEEFSITGASVCRKSGKRTIRWSGQLPQGKVIECSFRLRPLNITSFSSEGVLEYTEVGEKKTVNSGPISINVKEPKLRLESELSKSTGIRLGEPLILNIRLNNSDPEKDISVNRLEISFGDAVRVESYQGKLTSSGSIYFYNGKVLSEDTARINFTLKPVKTGKHSISEHLLYYLEGRRMDILEEEVFYVARDNLSVSLRAEGNTTGAGPYISVKLLAINTGVTDNYYELEVTTESRIEGLNTRVKLGELKTRSHTTAFSGNVTLPEQGPGPYAVNITLEYRTAFGELLSQSFSENITLHGTGQNKTEREAVQETASLTESLEHGEGEEEGLLGRLTDARLILRIFLTILFMAGLYGAAYLIKKRLSTGIPDFRKFLRKEAPRISTNQENDEIDRKLLQANRDAGKKAESLAESRKEKGKDEIQGAGPAEEGIEDDGNGEKEEGKGESKEKATVATVSKYAELPGAKGKNKKSEDDAVSEAGKGTEYSKKDKNKKRKGWAEEPDDGNGDKTYDYKGNDDKDYKDDVFRF